MVAVETTDKLTDLQLVAKVKEQAESLAEPASVDPRSACITGCVAREVDSR